MNAAQAIQIAKQLGIKGVFVQKFRGGQELREYSVPHNGGVWVGKIRALPVDHA